MQRFYNLFYILNSLNQNEKEEVLIDFGSVKELDDILNELPDYEPSENVLEKIFRFV